MAQKRLVDEELTLKHLELVAKWLSISRPAIPFGITGFAPENAEVLGAAGAKDPDGAEIPEIFIQRHPPAITPIRPA
ncbi:hypothetical protein EKN06_00545 [Croceicoccus ponticola]|uniref:Uncharacterized protein n=1 Tax=Croceicoccus ponticola TaxID=2217664 RepID=A0A437GZH0_9SPHN|nr:hypothetical protein [Croceicoccus ponticola]RVQ68758.1 hypothetical protein EKN06_00545 [Croceicoccus ponticola]